MREQRDCEPDAERRPARWENHLKYDPYEKRGDVVDRWGNADARGIRLVRGGFRLGDVSHFGAILEPIVSTTAVTVSFRQRSAAVDRRERPLKAVLKLAKSGLDLLLGAAE